MAITKERIKELIREHDENPNPNLGGLNFYAIYTSIVLANEGIDLHEWDNTYTDEMRHEAYKHIEPLISEAIDEIGGLEGKTK